MSISISESNNKNQDAILQEWLNTTFGDDDLSWNIDIDSFPTLALANVSGSGSGIDMMGLGVGEQDQEQEPIANVWGILVALDSGRESMTLTAGLVRQLLADASRS
jgi:hypothetical protein